MDLESIDLVTDEQLKAGLPVGMKKSYPVGLADKVNEIIQADDHMRGSFRADILGYMTVLRDGSHRIKDYINAVKFCSYRLSGVGVHKSYSLTFPERQAKLDAEGAPAKYQTSISTQYNKTKLVVLILQQAAIPFHLMNMDTYQEAINAQAKLMREANSELVRTQAANSILTHLKAPEKAKIEIDMNVSGGSNAMDELREITQQLREEQLKSIISGTSNAKEIAESTILRGEVVDE